MDKFLKIIIEWGLYLLVFILPWQTRWIIKEGSINNSYSEYGTFSLYGSDILLGCLLLLFFFYYLRVNRTKENTKLPMVFYGIALFDLIAFVSIFVAEDHILAIYKYLGLLMAIGLFALIVYFPYNKKKLLIFFSWALFIQAGIAIYQWFSQHSPVNKWFGMAPHVASEAGVSVVEAMGNLGFMERWLRAYGALPHPNILGGFLALGVLILLINYIKNRKATHYFKDEDYHLIFRQNIFFYFIIIASTIALFFSFSRSAWLTTLVFLGLILFISIFKKDFLTQKYLLPLVLYLGVAIFIVSFPFMNLIEARVESKGRIENISQNERASSSNMAIQIIKDKWLLGTGIGNYTKTQSSEYIKDKEGYFYQPAHNTFLLIATELGILGLLTFIFLLISVFFGNADPGAMIYRFPFFIALLILLYFDHWLWSLHFGVLYLWLIIGLSIRFFTLDSKESDVV